MACLLGHKWDGCKCEKCGKTRDEGHDWDLCKGKCKRCGKTQAEQHAWNGCKSTLCGKIRNKEHDYIGYICKKCGKLSNIQDENDLAEIAKSNDIPLNTKKEALSRITQVDLLDDIIKNCEALKEPAIKARKKLELLTIINNCDFGGEWDTGYKAFTQLLNMLGNDSSIAAVALYKMMLRMWGEKGTYMNNENNSWLHERLAQSMPPYINVDFVKLYLETRYPSELICLREWIDDQMIQDACFDFDDTKKKEIYVAFKIKDGRDYTVKERR